MKIWDTDGPIYGCAVFDYKGYSLSLSTVAQPEEMLIFPSESSQKNMTEQITGRLSLSCTVDDIMEAKIKIDAYDKKVKKATKN
jgi:hypothetical protein